MFEKKIKGTSSQDQHSVVDSNSKIDGDIHFSGSILINGIVNGNVSQDSDEESHLTLGKTGVIHGNISSTHIQIMGRLKGDVDAKEVVEMHVGCQIQGDCYYKELVMQAGSYFEGSFYPKYSNKNDIPTLALPKANQEKKAKGSKF